MFNQFQPFLMVFNRFILCLTFFSNNFLPFLTVFFVNVFKFFLKKKKRFQLYFFKTIFNCFQPFQPFSTIFNRFQLFSTIFSHVSIILNRFMRFHPFLKNYFALVLLSATVEKFSVSRMWDFFLLFF